MKMEKQIAEEGHADCCLVEGGQIACNEERPEQLLYRYEERLKQLLYR